MTVDVYGSLAERYDRMYRDDPMRAEFFKKLFRERGVSRVLDCACGTGRDLIMLHSLGFDVAGSDLSGAMLAEARRNLGKSGIDIILRKADFRQLEESYREKFDAVVCLSNSINEVLEERESVRALASMGAVLRPGGILVLDQGQSDATMANPPGFDAVVNDRDFSRLFVLDYSQSVMGVNIFDFVHTEEECAFYCTRVNIAIRLKDDWDRLLAAAGFGGIEYFGDFGFSGYDKQSSRRLIAVARK